jgi:hypothetical protein
MRNVDACMGAVLWLAVAVLLPMAALEPVVAHSAAPPPPALAFDSCGGNPHLAMGCAVMTL